MTSEFHKKLWECTDIVAKENKYKGWMCVFECFTGIEVYGPPFDDHLQCYFPVLEGTPHATMHLLILLSAKP